MNQVQDSQNPPPRARFPGLVVLGLGGTYCSGKSTVTGLLEALGASNIDVDLLGHQALVDEAPEVVEAFGTRVLTDPEDPASPVDRKKLGALVFADPSRLKILESIVHPAMVRMVESALGEAARNHAAAGGKKDTNNGQVTGQHGSIAPGTPGDAVPLGNLVVVNAALLFPMGLDRFCDLCIFLDSPWFLRLRRGLARDHRGLGPTLRRMQSQEGLFPKNPRRGADISIVKTRTSRHALEMVRQALGRWQLSWPKGVTGDEKGSR